jgi:hypothetical protein
VMVRALSFRNPTPKPKPMRFRVFFHNTTPISNPKP